MKYRRAFVLAVVAALLAAAAFRRRDLLAGFSPSDIDAVREGLAQELLRQPSDAEVAQWLRSHPE